MFTRRSFFPKRNETYLPKIKPIFSRATSGDGTEVVTSSMVGFLNILLTITTDTNIRNDTSTIKSTPNRLDELPIISSNQFGWDFFSSQFAFQP